MKFKFNQNIKCHNGDCSTKLQSKLIKLLNTSDRLMFHMSISHIPNNHIIWVFLYSKNNIHESEVRGKNVFNKNPDQPCKKFNGKIPTLEELKKQLK